jgi:four helix bundle protein
VQFHYLAQGSLTELKNQILLAKEVGYLTTEDFSKLLELANETHKILQGLIKSSKARI